MKIEPRITIIHIMYSTNILKSYINFVIISGPSGFNPTLSVIISDHFSP